MAKDIVNLMNHLGIEKAHVAGYSLGGFITTYIIANYPDRLLSAAPCGAGWIVAGDGRQEGSDLIAESLENGNGITPLIEALTPSGRPKPSPEQMEQMNKMILATNDTLALAAVARGMKHLTVTADELRASGVPVHAIVGGIDPLKESVDAMHEVLPSMGVTIIDGADHMTAFTNPDFIPALKAHLAANRADKHSKARAEAELTAAAN
jgi:pimeloyl-ACP methyl ester carboxylesterase